MRPIASRFLSLSAICWLASLAVGPVGSRPHRPLNPRRRPAAPQSSPASTSAPAPHGDAVAVIDGEPLSRATLDEAVAPQIAKLDEEAYEIRKQQLDDLINDRLFAAEAKRRDVTVDALIATEVTAKAGDVADADVQAFIATNRRRLPADPTALLPQIKGYLTNERIKTRREAFANDLRTKAHVQVLLKMPPFYRAPIDLAGRAVQGP